MNQIILISGGSSGVGKAIAKELSQDSNNKVIIFSTDEEKLKSTATELNCEYYVADVTDYSALETITKDIIQKYGKIDCLVNNAGIWIEGPLVDNDPDAIKRVLEVNTLGTIYLTKVVLPYMQKEKAGRIININSQGGLNSAPKRSIYYTSKWALTGFAKCIHEEVKEFGIKVSNIHPSLIQSPFYESAGYKRDDFSKAMQPEDVAKLVKFILTYTGDINISDTVIRHNLY